MIRKKIALLLVFALLLGHFHISVFANFIDYNDYTPFDDGHIVELELNLEDENEEERELSIVVASRSAPEESEPRIAVVYAGNEGVYSHRNWEPDTSVVFSNALAQASSGAFHLFGAIRSNGEAGVANVGDITIAHVEVLIGGQYQARFRDQAGRAHTVEAGLSGNWYTTSRNATLMDGRSFNIHTTIPAEVVSVAADYDAFLNSLIFTYGDLPFEQWLGCPTTGNCTQFNNANPATLTAGGRFIHWMTDDLLYNGDGTYTISSTIEFRAPYPEGTLTGNPAGVNIPWTGYRGSNQQGFSHAMRHLIGTFDFSVSSNITGVDVELASLPINLNLYDDFHLWNDIHQWAIDLRDEAGGSRTINGRHVNVTSLGQSHQGRELWNIVIAASQSAVDDYFTYRRPRMTGSLEDLEALQAEIENGVGHRIPIYFHNIHPDEVTGVDAQLVMVEELLRQEYITFETVREEDTFGLTTGAIWGTPPPAGSNYVSIGRGPLNDRNDTETVTISVEEALERFIFIFVPTNNPDGHYGMLRGNARGFDLNRDAAYQTQIENRLVVENMLKWNPLAMLEFHGHVAHMLIEPTTGPHNPNFEYDLLHPAMLRAAHIMGRAAISGAYDRYLIPAEHMADGWDDGGPMYMPIFLMHFGILGFTLEIPHTNQDSLDANVAMGWAFVDHAMDYFNELFFNKLEHNRRGMTNADHAHLVDQFFRNPFVDPSDPAHVIGRPRQEGQSFFPDYWVIPMASFNQWNRLEAYHMLEKLERHGIIIERTTDLVTHDGNTFSSGTYVIDMRQARRGYVNTMLEPGYDASIFTAMYAELTMNFPDLRGFDAIAIWEEDLFEGKTQVIMNVSMPATTIAQGETTHIAIRNNNQDAIRLVNDLLRAGNPVYMLTDYAEGGVMGDFVVERDVLTANVLEGRYLETSNINGLPVHAEELIQPRIAFLAPAPANMQGMHDAAPYVLRDLGFEYQWVTSNAQLGNLIPGVDFNLIVNHGQNWANAWSISNNDGIPVISINSIRATGGGISHNGGVAAAVNNLFSGRNAAGGNLTASREGTFLASYSPTSMITSHYERLNAAYLIGTFQFTSIPEGTTPLIQIADGSFEEVFLGGWWQGVANQNNIAGRVTAFTGITNADVPATVFGTNIFNRAHSQVYHNLFATAALMHVSEIRDTARPFVNATTTHVHNGSLLVNLEYVASEVAGSTATIIERMFMISNNPEAPVFNQETAVTDGWMVYQDPFIINPSEQFVHWFAVNSYNISAQGNLNFGVLTNYLPAVTGIVVTPYEDLALRAGESLQFEVTVEGINNPLQAVIWEIKGSDDLSLAEGTTISEGGLLIISEGQEAGILFIRVISVFDPEVYKIIQVEILAIDAYLHIITFNPNGGTVTPTTMQTKGDGTLASLPTPIRTGYRFLGWFTAVTGGTEITTSTVFDEDTTVYARWESGGGQPGPGQPGPGQPGPGQPGPGQPGPGQPGSGQPGPGQPTPPNLPQTGVISISFGLIGAGLLATGVIVKAKKKNINEKTEKMT